LLQVCFSKGRSAIASFSGTLPDIQQMTTHDEHNIERQSTFVCKPWNLESNFIQTITGTHRGPLEKTAGRQRQVTQVSATYTPKDFGSTSLTQFCLLLLLVGLLALQVVKAKEEH